MHQSSLPAILGGDPSVTADHSKASIWPVIGEEDEAAVLEVLRSGVISSNPVARELEQDYCERIGRRHALSHCNGTSALMAAFFAFGLEPGDEVLVPTGTFWASVLPMLWFGAVPVFCEGEPDRMGLDPADVERKITDRTKAMVLVHLWGLPSKMTELFEIAERHGLKILEDASHTHGAKWRGRPCGSFGDISVFSLQGDKLAPAGEGGVLLTDDDEMFEKTILFGDIMRIIELEGPSRRFAATSFGVKTRMASMSAALARVQLRHLDERNAQRKRNIEFISERIAPLGFETYLAPDHIDRVYFEYLIRNRPEKTGIETPLLVEALVAEGCQVSAPRYPLLHQQPFFTEGHWAKIARVEGWDRYADVSLPGTESLNEHLLRLPHFQSASDELLTNYVDAFEKVVSNAGDIARRSAHG